MTLEEGLEYARKSGLDVTIAELEEAAELQEMLPEAMNEVVGGRKYFKTGSKAEKCPATPNSEHQWVISGRD